MGSAALCLAEDKLATTFQTPFNGLPVHTISGQRANAGFGDRVLHRMFTVRGSCAKTIFVNIVQRGGGDQNRVPKKSFKFVKDLWHKIDIQLA